MKIIKKDSIEIWISPMKHIEEIIVRGIKIIKWYKNKLIHRDDGPAIIWVDGKTNELVKNIDWYFNGSLFHENEEKYWNK